MTTFYIMATGYLRFVTDIKGFDSGTTLSVAEGYGKKLYNDVLEQNYKRNTIGILERYTDKGIALTDDNGWVRLVSPELIQTGRSFGNAVVKPTLAVTVAGMMQCVLLDKDKKTTYALPLARQIKKMLSLLLDYGLFGKRMQSFRQDVVRDLLLAPFWDFCDTFGLLSETLMDKLHLYILELKSKLKKIYALPKNEPAKKKVVALMQLIAAYKGKNNAVFVYGPFMRGEELNCRITDEIYAGKYQLKGYSCYDTERGPIIVEDYYNKIRGELYFMGEQGFQIVEEYRRKNGWIDRKRVNIISQYGKIAVQACITE